MSDSESESDVEEAKDDIIKAKKSGGGFFGAISGLFGASKAEAKPMP